MTAATVRRRTRHSWVGHATATATALLLLRHWHTALHIGGDQYGGAWALIAAAWFLHWRTGWWIAWTIRITAVLGAVTDLPVLHGSVGWLTGAAW